VNGFDCPTFDEGGEGPCFAHLLDEADGGRPTAQLVQAAEGAGVVVTSPAAYTTL
jgi:hypothetical protein